MAEITRTFDLLDHLVEKYPKDDILAGKVNGEWVKYSSHDYYKFAHYLAYGLCEMGLKQGDRVVTMSGNCPEDIELHRPYIDAVTIRCPDCGKLYGMKSKGNAL